MRNPSETHVRLNYACSIVPLPPLRNVEEGRTAEGLEAREAGLRFLPARRTGACRAVLPVLVLGRGGCELDVVQDEDHGGTVLAGVLVGPVVFIQAAHEVHVGALLELHFMDAFDDRAEGLDRHVDPAGVVLGTGVVDLLAEAEAREVPLLGELHGRSVVVPPGYDGVGDDCVEHDDAPFCGLCRVKNYMFAGSAGWNRKQKKRQFAPKSAN